MTKKILKRKQKVEEEEVEKEDEPKKIMSDEPAAKKIKWVNKQRVLIFATRGINYRHRHLMDDLKKLMPHHRPECKMERTKNLQVVNEMCGMRNCNKAILFEGRKKCDLYVWFANVPTGPSAKFLIENIYTMGELKMTGNCLKGSRPLLSFDENFTTHAHYSLLKELLTQIFGVPNHHPKSQPFFDHVYTFSILDNRIWFRNFQILTEDGGLAEIGPRFVLNPVKIFAGSFGNDTLWDNPHYISPAKYRQSLTKKAANKYINRVEQKMAQEANKPDESYALNPIDEIFKGDLLEKAKEIEEKLEAFDKSENMEKITKKDKVMEENGNKRMRGRTRGRGRGRARGRARGKSKKQVKIIESDDEDTPQQTDDTPAETIGGEQEEHEPPATQQPSLEQQFDLEADISQLEAPTFTTINRGPPEPMLRLRWDHRVNLIGEKVLNPMIHCCDKCLKPILIYGRMIPCKHVFCLLCAKREDKVCPRCMEKVSRVEQTGLGTVFMCTHGGTRYGNAGCRRTYLSQRDLQAHINHRHISTPSQPVQGIQVDPPQYVHAKSEMESQLTKVSSVPMQNTRLKSVQSHMVQPIMGNDPRVNSLVSQQPALEQHRQQHRQQQQQQQALMSMQSYAQSTAPPPPPPNNAPMRTNLITVPIQDTASLATHDLHGQQSHHYYPPPPPPPPPPQVNYGYNVPPPVSQTTQQYYPQPQHPTQVSYVPPPPPPQQQQYVSSTATSIRPSPAGYIQEPQYGPPPSQQQPPPPPQPQWSQHQQQFYR